MEQLVVGFILFIVGGLNAVRPDFLMRFQIWTQKYIMGAEYIPSSRTYKIMRFFGVVMVILGLLVLVGKISLM